MNSDGSHYLNNQPVRLNDECTITFEGREDDSRAKYNMARTLQSVVGRREGFELIFASGWGSRFRGLL
jgi:hypothetical protein